MITRTQSQEGTVNVNGINIHYLERGDTRSTPMVLLHGLRGHGHSWDDIAAAFSPDYHVLALDQRGRGETDWASDGDYSTDAYVADLEGFCQAKGLDSFVLVGHSMGGRNSLLYASRHPETLQKLVVVDVGPEMDPKGSKRITQEIIDVPEEFDSFEAVMEYMGALQDGELVEDVNVAIDYLQNHYQRTQGQKIGIVGYCVGCRISYLAATSCPGLSAASVYYGGRILVPFGDGLAPVDLTDKIKIPVMGNFGDQDSNPTPDDVAQIEAKLTAAGVTHDFKMYEGAGHGFNCDERDSYHEASAKDALERTLGWFDKYVKN